MYMEDMFKNKGKRW